MTSQQRTATVDVRAADDRFHTRIPWLDSRHSFSFGGHYDQRNTHFGLLLVSNDDRVRAGAGFETHPHQDMEIVTWVLSGSLVHQDSQGHSGVIYPGLAQRMTAGSGILHSEKNDSWRLTGEAAHDEDVHFVQMWVLPDTDSLAPGYQQLDIGAELDKGELVVVASGMERHRDERAIAINQRSAALHAARLAPGATAALPASPFAHIFVARGSAVLEGGSPAGGAVSSGAGLLGSGDAARITGSDGQRITAGVEGAEVLVWEMHAGLGSY